MKAVDSYGPYFSELDLSNEANYRNNSETKRFELLLDYISCAEQKLEDMIDKLEDAKNELFNRYENSMDVDDMYTEFGTASELLQKEAKELDAYEREQNIIW